MQKSPVLRSGHNGGIIFATNLFLLILKADFYFYCFELGGKGQHNTNHKYVGYRIPKI